MKTCSNCCHVLPQSGFAPDRGVRSGLRSRCRNCDSATNRERKLQRRYGLTRTQYDMMLYLQGGHCAICEVASERNGKALAVDHKHPDGPVRGLLCDKHNRALGLFNDDPTALRRAADYLERFS